MKGVIFIIIAASLIILEDINPQSKSDNNSQVECPFNDKGLSKEKIGEMIKHFWPERKNITSIKILKIRNTDDWLIEYHDGLPKYMYTNRKISYVFKKNTDCFNIDNLVFYRDYLGGGQYGEIYAGYTDEKIKNISCGNQ